MRFIFRMLEVLGGLPGLGFLRVFNNKLMAGRASINTRIHDVKYKARELDDARLNAGRAVGDAKKKSKMGKKGKKGDPAVESGPSDAPTDHGGSPYGDASSPGRASGGYGSPADGAAPPPKGIPGIHVSRRKNLREERERDREMRRRRS